MDGSPVGLQYGAIEPVLRLEGIPKKEWRGVFHDLRIMEDAALAQIRKEQKAAKK